MQDPKISNKKLIAQYTTADAVGIIGKDLTLTISNILKSTQNTGEYCIFSL